MEGGGENDPGRDHHLPRNDASDPLAWWSRARAVLSNVDIILGNEDELLLLAGQREAQLQFEAVVSSGVALLVRKLGAKGVEACARDQSCAVLPRPVRVVSTIGAGDGFAAGFLYALDRHLPLEECLRYGNAAAAVVVSRVSCSDAMPRPDELREFLEATKTVTSEK